MKLTRKDKIKVQSIVKQQMELNDINSMKVRVTKDGKILFNNKPADMNPPLDYTYSKGILRITHES